MSSGKLSDKRAVSASRRPIDALLDPFLRFASVQASGGIVLFAATVAALLWANFAGHSYEEFFEQTLRISFGDLALGKSLRHWINDGLMVIFFFVVGLEIKRELLIGELNSTRKAALPVAAALGGMVAPAVLYLAWNAGTEGARGWGIPMATDIAFTIGVLTLLGTKVPFSLKVFLIALAIVDDLGAILVIAVFYSHDIGWWSLGAALVLLVGLAGLNVLGARHPLPYALFGIALWLAFLQSGIHATIAGVLLAMTIPASTNISTDTVISSGRYLISKLEEGPRSPGLETDTADEQQILETLEEVSLNAQTPMQRLEHVLSPWSTFLIMPVFALANAGLDLGSGLTLGHPVSLGIVCGLVIGKPVGIALFSWVAVRSGLAVLMKGVSWRQIIGGGCLAGIGFTMSLFIASLAFGNSPLLDVAKAGILTASFLSACLGALVLWRR